MRLPFRLAPLGWWKWPSLLTVTLLPLAFYIASWRPALEPRAFGTSILGPTRLGPWVAVLGTEAAIPLRTRSATVRIRFCDGCYEAMRSVHIGYGDRTAPAAGQLVRVTGDANSLEAPLTRTDATRTSTHLWLVVQAWDGTAYTHAWVVR